MTTNEQNSLGDEGTLAAARKRRPEADVSLGDERTLGVAGAELDTMISDIEVVDLEARYKIEGTLGQGGMGAVLLATDTRLDRKVAIKRILGEAAGNRMAVQRFLTEAKAIAALNHPNIVQIYDYGQAKDGPFLIMEYVDGGSLLEQCRESALPIAQAIELSCQLCDGLAKAHDLGIVHRDIKPANVLLTKDGIPKLTDFGLAKAEANDHGMTMTGAVMGTPDFMPPEQRRDASLVDHRSDLWSLAATVYQMLTGRIPKIIRFDLLPAELTKVFGKALEDAKEARYQSARELREAFKVAAGGMGVTTKASTPAPVITDELHEGQCKACGTITSDLTKKFCRNPKCGASLRVACLKCNAQIPVWDGVCGECGGNQPTLAVEVHHVAEARKHLAAFDYASAIHALDSIPESCRGTQTSQLLDDVRGRHAESQQLLAEIAAKIKRKEIDGLLPSVERAVTLRGDRQDLQKIRNQLVERRDRRVARAQSAMEEGDARAAVAALQGAAPEDFGERATIITQARNAAAIEARLAGVLREAKADGVVTRAEASGLLALCEEYLRLNPKGAKVRELATQCRELLHPSLIRNSVGVQFRRIDPGSFTMGQSGASFDEKPQRVALTKTFYIGVYEVTNAQWKRVMGAVPSKWKDDDRPVEQVSLFDAIMFCQTLSQLPEERAAGRVYRLPTEVQWEYACRAGTTTQFSFGNNEARLSDYAWHEGNAGRETHPVGQKKPNNWGLYDMHGNVSEWCVVGVERDDGDPYECKKHDDGNDVRAPEDDGEWIEVGVCRGGCWAFVARKCRSASSLEISSEDCVSHVGFRLVMTQSESKTPKAAE